MKTKLVGFLTTLFATTIVYAHQNDYSVSLTPPNPIAGAPATLSWKAPANAYTWGDWIGAYMKDRPLEVIKVRDLNGSTLGSQTVTFSTVANWVLQYFRGDSRRLAMSAPFPVSVRTDTEAYSLSVSTNRAFVGTQVSVSWDTGRNLNLNGDTIGCYRRSNPNELVANVSTDGRESGTIYFSLAGPGEVAFRYYKAGKVVSPVTDPVHLDIVPSPPKLSLSFVGNNTVVSWYGFQNATYSVFASPDLSVPLATWTEIGRFNGANGFLSITNARAGDSQFYTVKEVW